MSPENIGVVHENSEPKWEPVEAIDRRVLGVLVEKAKTTPNGYPLSLSGVVTGCNQKSNRDPLMKVEPEDVEESLERLRKLGAVGEISGHGRVAKYRHYLYDWLGVEKVELAVMAELLLRGEQTVGELRGRAARMEKIVGVEALRPILDSLKTKELVVGLTPEGRGHLVTHALLSPEQLQRLARQYSSPSPVSASSSPSSPRTSSNPQEGGAAPSSEREVAISSSSPAPPVAGYVDSRISRSEFDELRLRIAELRAELDETNETLRQTREDVRRLNEDLG